MSPSVIFGALMGAVIGLAVFVLWIRDRHRDRVGMPQEARKEAEKKLSRGVHTVYFIVEAFVAFTAVASLFRKGTFGRDFLSLAAVAAFLWVECKRWRGSWRPSPKNDVREIFTKSQSMENWKPPGAPPPIG